MTLWCNDFVYSYHKLPLKGYLFLRTQDPLVKNNFGQFPLASQILHRQESPYGSRGSAGSVSRRASRLPLSPTGGTQKPLRIICVARRRRALWLWGGWWLAGGGLGAGWLIDSI